MSKNVEGMDTKCLKAARKYKQRCRRDGFVKSYDKRLLMKFTS